MGIFARHLSNERAAVVAGWFIFPGRLLVVMLDENASPGFGGFDALSSSRTNGAPAAVVQAVKGQNGGRVFVC